MIKIKTALFSAILALSMGAFASNAQADLWKSNNS